MYECVQLRINERCKAVLHVNEIDLLVIAFDDDQYGISSDVVQVKKNLYEKKNSQDPKIRVKKNLYEKKLLRSRNGLNIGSQFNVA